MKVWNLLGDRGEGLVERVAKAVGDERERCAKIAETYLSDYQHNLSPSCVASAIRNQEGELK